MSDPSAVVQAGFRILDGTIFFKDVPIGPAKDERLRKPVHKGDPERYLTEYLSRKVRDIEHDVLKLTKQRFYVLPRFATTPEKHPLYNAYYAFACPQEISWYAYQEAAAALAQFCRAYRNRVPQPFLNAHIRFRKLFDAVSKHFKGATFIATDLTAKGALHRLSVIPSIHNATFRLKRTSDELLNGLMRRYDELSLASLPLSYYHYTFASDVIAGNFYFQSYSITLADILASKSEVILVSAGSPYSSVMFKELLGYAGVPTDRVRIVTLLANIAPPFTTK